jgi:hypothetical protein
MKLYLIRHGQTEANARNLYYGSSDLPLMKAELKAYLSALIGNIPSGTGSEAHHQRTDTGTADL